MKKVISYALWSLAFITLFLFSACDKGGGGGGTGASTSSQSIAGHTGDAQHFYISDIKYQKDVNRPNIARFTVTFSQNLGASSLSDVMSAKKIDGVTPIDKKSIFYLDTAFLKQYYNDHIKSTKTYQELKQVYSWKQVGQTNQVTGAISLWGIADKNDPDTRDPIPLPDGANIQIKMNEESIPAVKDDSGHRGYTASPLVRDLASGQ